MSIVRVISIWCDVCEEEFDGGEVTATMIRGVAKKDGWHYRGGRDICATCWEKGER